MQTTGSQKARIGMVNYLNVAPILDRITSYNVCYTKLLRISKRYIQQGIRGFLTKKKPTRKVSLASRIWQKQTLLHYLAGKSNDQKNQEKDGHIPEPATRNNFV